MGDYYLTHKPLYRCYQKPNVRIFHHFAGHKTLPHSHNSMKNVCWVEIELVLLICNEVNNKN